MQAAASKNVTSGEKWWTRFRQWVQTPVGAFVSMTVLTLALVLYGVRTDYFLYNPQILTALSAFSIPIVAAFGALIAHRQARTAAQQKQISKTKLRLDLFDRRLKIYDAANNIIRKIVTSGKVDRDVKFEYAAAIQGAKWLLNDEIHTYLNETLLGKILELEDTDSYIGDRSLGVTRTEKKVLYAKHDEIHAWLKEQLKALDRLFSPFLKFRIER